MRVDLREKLKKDKEELEETKVLKSKTKEEKENIAPHLAKPINQSQSLQGHYCCCFEKQYSAYR